jgi:tmRNA-binding protein
VAYEVTETVAPEFARIDSSLHGVMSYRNKLLLSATEIQNKKNLTQPKDTTMVPIKELTMINAP